MEIVVTYMIPVTVYVETDKEGGHINKVVVDDSAPMENGNVDGVHWVGLHANKPDWKDADTMTLSTKKRLLALSEKIQADCDWPAWEFGY